jgi:zinc D-Ala-D-Ala carboxypeptidase
MKMSCDCEYWSLYIIDNTCPILLFGHEIEYCPWCGNILFFTSTNIIDLNSSIPDAPNFTYDEFVRSSTATRLQLNNIPNNNQWKNIELLAKKVLQPIRNQFGPIRITSGFRSPDVCVAIGSSKRSYHTKGQAVDFIPINRDIKLVEIIIWIYRNLDYHELICEYFPNGWIHIAYRESKNKKVLKLKDKYHNYSLIDLNFLITHYLD